MSLRGGCVVSHKDNVNTSLQRFARETNEKLSAGTAVAVFLGKIRNEWWEKEDIPMSQ